MTEQLKRLKQNFGYYDSGDEIKKLERRINNLLIDKKNVLEAKIKGWLVKRGRQKH